MAPLLSPIADDPTLPLALNSSSTHNDVGICGGGDASLPFAISLNAFVASLERRVREDKSLPPLLIPFMEYEKTHC